MGVVVHTSNDITWEAEPGDHLSSTSPGHTVRPCLRERTLRRKAEGKKGKRGRAEPSRVPSHKQGSTSWKKNVFLTRM